MVWGSMEVKGAWRKFSCLRELPLQKNIFAIRKKKLSQNNNRHYGGSRSGAHLAEYVGFFLGGG
jgi:hypothetical protein